MYTVRYNFNEHGQSLWAGMQVGGVHTRLATHAFVCFSSDTASLSGNDGAASAFDDAHGGRLWGQDSLCMRDTWGRIALHAILHALAPHGNFTLLWSLIRPDRNKFMVFAWLPSTALMKTTPPRFIDTQRLGYAIYPGTLFRSPHGSSTWARYKFSEISVPLAEGSIYLDPSCRMESQSLVLIL